MPTPEYYASIVNIVAENGQMLQGVMGEPDFMYTIGNASLGLPELLFIGNMRPEVIGQMLNEMGQMQRDGTQFVEGLNEINWSVPVKVRKCGPKAKSEYTIQAGQYLGNEDYEVLQVLIPDNHGKYQDEEGVTDGWAVDLP